MISSSARSGSLQAGSTASTTGLSCTERSATEVPPIWMHRVAAQAEMDSPRHAVMSQGGLSVRVPDVDAHYARVKAAGARLDSAPTDQPYGLREYGVRDLENHRWWFSTPLA